jgi:hypothetical protein
MLRRTPALQSALWHAGVLMALCLGLLACDRKGPITSHDVLEAPSGQGSYVEGSQARTVFETLGVITYGDTVSGTMSPPEVLAGWVFVGEAGNQPQIRLEGGGAGPALVALYGPRDSRGLWGEPRFSRSGVGGVGIEDWIVPSSGDWFILVRGQRGVPYTLSLDCADCAAPQCAAIEPCDLVCEAGFSTGADDCRQCACVQAIACEPACTDDERCVEGVCQARSCIDQCPDEVQPLCGSDGRTYRNLCAAECAGVNSVGRGACPETCEPGVPGECPESQICVRGQCVLDDCGCASAGPPVCTEAGHTERNRCLAQCRDQAVLYEGDCVAAACQDSRDCTDGFACVVAQRPGNLSRCRNDPQAADCIRECVPRRCDAHSDCADHQRCAATGESRACLDRCVLGGDTCRAPLVCAAVDGALPGEGLCALGCDPADEAPCAPGQICAPSDSGPALCVPCMPGEPGCGPNQECSRCPIEGVPVCGADGQLYLSACEAQCNGVEATARDLCGVAQLPLGCRVNEDCRPTGCDAVLCAAAPTDACPGLSAEQACVAEFGHCGCLEGRCAFERTRESVSCVQRSRPDRRP